MKTKVASKWLAICALALSSAAFGQANCNSGCTVYVSLPGSCGSGINVSLDPIKVDRGQAPVITWEMSPNSPWLFDEKRGIDFLNWDEHAKDGFEGRPASQGRRRCTVKNISRKASSYKYDINLVREIEGVGGKAPITLTCKLDPTVVNY